MATLILVTHPDVLIDPAVPVPEWPLSERGRTRMTAGCARPWAAAIGAIWCSTERKAIDAAEILAAARGLSITTLADLGENDRSSTGYLPRVEFEAMANQFFAHPEQSIRGWERAVDAQRRMLAAFETVQAATPRKLDVAVIAHGAVGALLLCALKGVAISRVHDQPPGSGGYYFAVDRMTGLLRHGWQAIDG